MVEESQGFFKQRKTSEVAESEKQKQQEHCLAPYLEYLSYGLALLMVLGEMMMLCTSFYFHTLAEKVVGTLCGLLSWYVVYRRMYTGRWCPSYQETKSE